MFKTARLLFPVLISLFTCSCEYPLDKENKRNIQPPSPTHQFDLSLVPEQDTILIFSNTILTYNINTYGLDMKQADFFLQGKSWNVGGGSSTFTISPEDFTPGYDTLKAIIYTNTGTGSLGDVTGVESYRVEKMWHVLIDGRPAPEISLSKSITSDGYLKISWPACNQYNFGYYMFYAWTDLASFSKRIADADSNSCTDSCFIGGKASYRVDLKVASNPYTGYGNGLSVDEPFPLVNFEEIGIDSVKIHWDKSPYKATYKLQKSNYPDTLLLVSHTATSYTIPNPGLGINAQYTLTTLPYRPTATNESYNQDNTNTYVLGQYISYNWPDYAYNRFDKVVYTNTYDDIKCFDVHTLDLLKTFYINQLGYQGIYACPTNSTRMAALSPDNIYVFANKQLLSFQQIPYSCFGQSIDHFCLTDNDVIAIAQPNKYTQIRVSDKQVIASINIADYPVYSKWACISTSKDARYACLVTKNGVNLYEILIGVATIRYTDARIYRSVTFDESDAALLYLTFYENNNLEIRRASDFSLVRTIILPTKAEVLRNFDPESGYLLLTDYLNLYVLDVSASQIKFKLKCDDFKPQLYANRLFTNSGYSLDIAKYLKK
ncbi:MAG: hypothetical protein WCR72_06685 [Bacteroidota bacterium]